MRRKLASPNVVLFVASDLGYGDVGCYGSTAHRTPNIDRLAGNGVRFTDGHSNGCMCSPSRAALLTGLYPQRVGIEFVLNHATRTLPPMRSDAFTYGRAFRDAGYATGFFGTYHTGYLPQDSPLKMGFDEFRGLCGGMDHHSHVTRWGEPNWWHGEQRVDEEGYSTDLITNHALQFINRHRQDRFCLHVADFLVHFPWQGPHDPPDFEPGRTYDSPETKYGSRSDRRRAYKEMVEAMDASVGRIVERIAALGLVEKTLILFASDHGGHDLVADHGPLAGAKGTLLEGGHRIPAVACWPGTIAGGRTIDDMVMLMDLFPTFRDLCNLGSARDVHFDGTSLAGLLLDGKRMPQRARFWRQGHAKAARRGPWKLLVDPAGGNRLFNLDTDLGETRDLGEEEPQTRDSLADALARWEADIPPPPEAS